VSAFSLASCRGGWDRAAAEDAIGNILTDEPYTREEFFQTGRYVVEGTFAYWEAEGIEAPKNGMALDFGCGLGRLTRALAERYEAVGVDVSAGMVERASEDAPDGCRFAVNDTPDLSQFRSRSFALVYSLLVLQHMPPRFQRGYVSEFVRLLKPSGLAYFQIPDGPDDLPYTSWLTMYGATAETVTGWVSDAGGEVLAIQEARDAGTWASYRYTVRRKGQG
jgi:SAM-dependent methyltransferase